MSGRWKLPRMGLADKPGATPSDRSQSSGRFRFTSPLLVAFMRGIIRLNRIRPLFTLVIVSCPESVAARRSATPKRSVLLRKSSVSKRPDRCHVDEIRADPSPWAQNSGDWGRLLCKPDGRVADEPNPSTG